MESQRGWQMPAFPCKELDLILNEVEQDLIYILKVLFWLLSGEWVIGEQSEAWRQIRRRSQVRDDDGVEQGGYQ